jgi:hypothetical protein
MPFLRHQTIWMTVKMNLVSAIAALCLMGGSDSYVTSVSTEQAKCQAYYASCIYNFNGFKDFTKKDEGTLLLECMRDRKYK